MYLLKWFFSDEIEEMRVSISLSSLQIYVEERFEGTGLYKKITYHKSSGLIWIHGDGSEIGVIGKIKSI